MQLDDGNEILMRISRRLLIGAMLVSITVSGLSACAPGWLRSQVFLSDLLSNVDEATVSGQYEATEELCEGVAGCIEAWVSDQAYFYRFDSNAAAEDFVEGVEDGFQSDRIGVDFGVTDPSPEVKRQIQDLVEGAHSLT